MYIPQRRTATSKSVRPSATHVPPPRSSPLCNPPSSPSSCSRRPVLERVLGLGAGAGVDGRRASRVGLVVEVGGARGGPVCVCESESQLCSEEEEAAGAREQGEGPRVRSGLICRHAEAPAFSPIHPSVPHRRNAQREGGVATASRSEEEGRRGRGGTPRELGYPFCVVSSCRGRASYVVLAGVRAHLEQSAVQLEREVELVRRRRSRFSRRRGRACGA